MGATARGLFGILGRVAPPADSDAALLDRYARAADAEAFAALVRRHGPMVYAVCRRRLGQNADAEDAFQAVFLALAKSAGRVRALPAWLYRAAYLVALKAAGRRARRPAEPLPVEVQMPDPPPAWETAEVRAAVDAEVADLPEKLRAVVVLCLLDGRTNAEAAGVLGIPSGTVDSRLHAARRTLQARLTRRGLAVGAAVAFDQMLGGPVGAAGPRVTKLIDDTIPAVLAEAARPGSGALSAAVSDLSRGITTMTTNVRALAALGLAVGLLGTAGAGMYLTAAPEPTPTAAAAQEPKQDALPGKKVDPPKQKRPTPDGALAAAAVLDEKFGVELPANATSMRELLDVVEDSTELIVRVDVAAFRRLEGGVGGPDDSGFSSEFLLNTLYDTKLILPRRHDSLPIRDVLGDALAQARLNIPCTYQVRGNQLVIVPAYQPPSRPGANPLVTSDDDADTPIIEARRMHEQIYGGVVAVNAEQKSLAEILADLRKQTGANIVLDPRTKEAGGKAALTLTLSDVRLYDALRVIADMAELKLVYAGNIYYVTTTANARTFQPARPAPVLMNPPGTVSPPVTP